MREVRVHHHERVAPRGAEARDDRAREAGLARAPHDVDRDRGREARGDVRGPVGRAVVHDDKLPFAAGERGVQPLSELRYRSGLVVCGHDDREHQRPTVRRPMRVVFDARHLQTVSRTRGIGRYSRNLLAAFARRAPDDIAWTLLTLANFPRADPTPLPPPRPRATIR